MNLVQTLIDALSADLTLKLGSSGYTVEAREPAEGELVATKDVKQVFITTEGIEFPNEEHATQGASSRVMIPVLVACVMQRPGTVVLAAKTLKRRLTLTQAVQRVRREFAQTHSEALVRFVQEQPQLIEGYYVSITGLELEFDLPAEEEL